MNHDAAGEAIRALFEGRLAPGRRDGLRAHLSGCSDCRSQYDRTALAFRAARRRPDEMSPDELYLFEPPLPQGRRAIFRRPLFGVGVVAAAAAAGFALYASRRSDEFAPRGATAAAGRPALRVFCSRGEGAAAQVVEAAPGACAAGDRLLFAVAARAYTHAALAIAAGGQTEVVLAGEAGALGAAAESPLKAAATWREGARAVAVFARAPVDAATARACAEGACAPGLDRAIVDLAGSVEAPR